jgi:hypothetical protein
MTVTIVNAGGRFGWVSASFGVPNATATKIQSFSKLPAGWHYGQGTAPIKQVIDAAIALNNSLNGLGLFWTDAFPGASGEILVTAYYGAHQIDLIVETDLTVSLTYEHNEQELRDIHRASVKDALDELTRIAGEIWSTSGYFTPGTLTLTPINLPAWHSGTATAAPPSFKAPAWMPLEQRSANTSGDIILMSAVNRQSSGYLKRDSSRRATA